MQTILKYLVPLVITIFTFQLNAQDSIQAQKINNKLEILETKKASIESEERDFLKKEVEEINIQLDKKEITPDEANTLKKEMAQKRALNIENRIAIIDNQIELLKRNDENYKLERNSENRLIIRIGGNNDAKTGDKFIFIGDSINDKSVKYDRRTSNDLLFAIGLNNAIIEGQDLNDSPYEIGGSRFVELGWHWKTRLLKNSNFIRMKYGFSFQWNRLSPKDNAYFVQNEEEISLETFPNELKKSKLRTTNLVFPLHFEFGPSKKIEKKTYFRYSTHNKFKIGIGGYGGFRLGTLQKLKYKEDGKRTKDKIKRSYNTSNIVYGLSGYIGVGNTSLYAKYDLSPVFNNQAVKQNNISLGVRFDID